MNVNLAENLYVIITDILMGLVINVILSFEPSDSNLHESESNGCRDEMSMLPKINQL